jgi:hypothetical protein
MELVSRLPSVGLLSLSSSEPESAQARAARAWMGALAVDRRVESRGGESVSPPTYFSSTYLTVLLFSPLLFPFLHLLSLWSISSSFHYAI